MLPARIAARFLTATKGQTALIVFGIAMGVAVQVFVGVLITSLQATLLDRTVGSSPHITILSGTDEPVMDDWERVVAEAEATPGVTRVSPAADGSVFLIQGNRTLPVVLRGLELQRAECIYKLGSRIYEGRLPSSDYEVIIGRELSEELNLRTGGALTIQTSAGARATLNVTGLFDLRVASLNRAWLPTTLRTAQSILGYGAGVTSVELQVARVFEADRVAGELRDRLERSGSGGLEVLDWKGQNAQLLSGLQAQSLSSYMIQFFVIVSVVVAIASVLAIKVVQKSREIGILKAMGIRDESAGLVFLYQGAMLGGAGALLGICIGAGLLLGFYAGASGAGGGASVDIVIDPLFLLGSWLLALLSSCLASLIPARRTSRLSPIEVIRGG
ncbi:MAG: FtsX-like permease family protein [Thermoplasmata archaeon]